MKLVVLSLISLSASFALAKPLTALGLVEKASYQIGGQVALKKIDASYLTDIQGVRILGTPTGFQIQFSSASSSAGKMNTFTILFDGTGKLRGTQSTFVSASAQSPIFKVPSSAVYLDKLAEAFVDHFGEAAENLEIAQMVTSIQLVPIAGGLRADLMLTDQRVYHVVMDSQAKILSRGF